MQDVVDQHLGAGGKTSLLRRLIAIIHGLDIHVRPAVVVRVNSRLQGAEKIRLYGEGEHPLPGQGAVLGQF